MRRRHGPPVRHRCGSARAGAVGDCVFAPLLGLRADVERAALGLAASFGAAVATNVTKKTTLVVMGGFDPATLRPGATMSSKIERAKRLGAEGQHIEIVTEQTFLEILASS